jgi:hypothetical protein
MYLGLTIFYTKTKLMANRRNFLVKTGMIATGLLVLRPFKSLASGSYFQLTGTGNHNNKLIFLHTGNNPKHQGYAEQKINSLKKNNDNILLINNEPGNYAEESYQLIYQGNIKTGIIQAHPGNTITELNDLSAFLKKEKNCQLVICLSMAGYKNKKGLDDRTLAEKSTHIDIIIGNHATNHTAFPVVTRNSRKEEVILHSAVDNGFGLGNIEIGYDERTAARKSLSFNNLLTRLPETA